MRVCALFLIGCASLHYDKPPTPAWIHQSPTRMDPGTAEIVGSTQATEDLRGDAERAFANAKQRLAESLVSQVRTQSNDWSWSSGNKEQTVVEQTVDVRTDIKLEGVTQTQAYRDEVTASQYVLARMDFTGYANRVSGRLQPTLDSLLRGLADAKAKEQSRTLEAYLSLLKLRNLANTAMDDMRLLGVIAARDKTLSGLRTVMRNIDELTTGIAARATFAITVSGPDAEANERLKSAAKEVFVRWGFSEANGSPPAVSLSLNLDTKRLADDTRGGRTEFVYAAVASARLQQRAGDWSALGAALQDSRYTETHASEPEAKKRALQTGGETLMSMWRSLGRSLMQ